MVKLINSLLNSKPMQWRIDIGDNCYQN
jgi:hypothetical protein